MTDSEDEIERGIAYIQETVTERYRHRQRPLIDHLLGCESIARTWGASPLIRLVALFHSAYGTEVSRPGFIALRDRGALTRIVGSEAERLIYLFCTLPRTSISLGTGCGSEHDLECLRLLELINIAEQGAASDDVTGGWVSTLTKKAALMSAVPPLLRREVLAEDEYNAWDAYSRGTQGDLDGHLLLRAHSACPLLPEPSLWLALLARRQGSDEDANWWCSQARMRYETLGTCWDKSRSMSEWLTLLEQVESGSTDHVDPRRSSKWAGRHELNLERTRLEAYLSQLTDPYADRRLRRFPGLRAEPWYDSSSIPLAMFLEAHADEIRAEVDLIIAKHELATQKEGLEAHDRWDVLALNGRGDQDELLDGCPLLQAVVTRPDAPTPLLGRVAISRLNPRARVKPHRGPTNMRIRCHFALAVPEGECGIRVGEVVRRWEVDKTIVFDDYFEHEVWNNTPDERLVLIVDLWHPDLRKPERVVLKGLQEYALEHAGSS